MPGFAIPEGYRTADSGEATQQEPPPPSVLDGLLASARVTRDLSPMIQDGRLNEGYGALAQSLDAMEAREKGQQALIVPLPVYSAGGKDATWQRVEKRRAAGLPLPPGIPATREEYEQSILSRGGAFYQDQQISNAAPWYVRVPGSLVGGLSDPSNIIGFGAGKGVGLVRGMLIEGGINMGTEVVLTPANIKAAKRLGQETTFGDVVTNVTLAGVLGAGLHGTARGVDFSWNNGARPVFEKVVAANFDRLPASVQARWTKASSLEPDDALLADVVEAIVPPENRSPALEDALFIAKREGQIDRASPFGQQGAGPDAHRAGLGATIDRILADTPDPAPPSARPLPSFTPPAGGGLPPAPGGKRTGTALGTGTVAEPGSIDSYMLRNRSAESSGDDYAKAATSSAYGRYQFIKSTWKRYYIRRYGRGGLTDEQIYAKRADGNIQDALMRDLTNDNAGFLRSWGEPVTHGNLYLVHFSGPDDARRIFEADPNTPIEQVMRAESIAANPWLRGKTAGWVRAWADRKMGGKGQVVSGDGRMLDTSAEAARVTGLQSEVDRLNADSARIRAEMAEEAGQRYDPAELDAVDARPEPIDYGSILPEPGSTPTNLLARLPDAGPVEVLDLAERIRPMVEDKARNLNDLDAMAAELGVSTSEVRTAMLELVKDKGGGLRIRKKDGAFVRRVSSRSAISGPDDVLEFIASRGGLRDDEGHNLGLKGLSSKQKKEMISDETRARALAARRSGAKSSRNWQTMTRRSGPLLRHEGRKLDSVGEMLYEAGYLQGADGGRPTTAEVLDYLEERISSGQPRYTLEDQARMAQDPASPEYNGPPPDGLGPNSPEEAVRAASWDILMVGRERFGLTSDDLTDDFLDHAARLHIAEGADADPAQALVRLVNDYADRVQWDAFDELGGDRYGDIDYDWSYDPLAEREAGAAEGDRGGPGPVSGDTGTRGNGGPAAGEGGPRPDPPPLAELPEAALTEFLDPAGPAAKAQLDSLEHDAKAEMGLVAHEDLGDGSWVRIFQRADGVEIDYNIEGWAGGTAGIGKTEAEAMAMALRRLQSNPNDSVQTPRILKAAAKARSWIEARQAEGGTNAVTPQRRYDEANAAFNQWETGTFQPAREAFYRGELTDVEFARLQTERQAMLKAIDDAEADLKAAPTPSDLFDGAEARPKAASAQPALFDHGDAVDPGIAARQKQQAQLGAQAPMQAKTDQDVIQSFDPANPNLFDAVDQKTFRLDAESEDGTSLRDMLDGFDAEQAEIKNARDCL